jgi:DNA-binding PadR family transcriptional regulator
LGAVDDRLDSRDIIHNVKQTRTAPQILGEFEQLVLFVLLRLGPDAYGATIRREIESRTGRHLAISAVYVTLERLEGKGLVRSRIGEPTPERGGRRRKHYELLPAGRRAATHAYRTFQVMVHGLEREFGKS